MHNLLSYGFVLIFEIYIFKNLLKINFLLWLPLKHQLNQKNQIQAETKFHI